MDAVSCADAAIGLSPLAFVVVVFLAYQIGKSNA